MNKLLIALIAGAFAATAWAQGAAPAPDTTTAAPAMKTAEPMKAESMKADTGMKKAGNSMQPKAKKHKKHKKHKAKKEAAKAETAAPAGTPAK